MKNASTNKSAKQKPITATPVREIRFNYIKSAVFRTIHVDGVHGGLTPQGRVQMAIFSERFPIPQQTTHPLIGNQPGDELRDQRIGKVGVVREVEANLIMESQQAESIARWLLGKVAELKRIQTKNSSSVGRQSKKKNQ